jgi:Cdc6-like AAA superfamily ATPase
MIEDGRVFRDDHLPRELQHREGAVRELSGALEPAIRERPADDVLVSGPSGVGKTVLARHTLQRLQQHVGVPHAHIRCLGETRGSIFREALRQHPQGRDLPRTTPVDDVLAELRSVLDRPFVVILDEADDLPRSKVLEDACRVFGLSMIAISHDQEQWLAPISDRVRRSIATKIQLDRFGVDELADILERRADIGLRSGVVSREQLQRIADEVAGVARAGIQSLRAAAELAREREHGEIRDVDVDDSFERARRRIREANLRSLPWHHQVLYALVHEAGTIGAGELHDRYDQVSEQLYEDSPKTPIGKRSRRNKLSKLRDYGLVLDEGKRQNRKYRVVDEAVKPAIEMPRRTPY